MRERLSYAGAGLRLGRGRLPLKRLHSVQRKAVGTQSSGEKASRRVLETALWHLAGLAPLGRILPYENWDLSPSERASPEGNSPPGLPHSPRDRYVESPWLFPASGAAGESVLSSTPPSSCRACHMRAPVRDSGTAAHTRPAWTVESIVGWRRDPGGSTLPHDPRR